MARGRAPHRLRVRGCTGWHGQGLCVNRGILVTCEERPSHVVGVVQVAPLLQNACPGGFVATITHNQTRPQNPPRPVGGGAPSGNLASASARASRVSSAHARGPGSCAAAARPAQASASCAAPQAAAAQAMRDTTRRLTPRVVPWGRGSTSRVGWCECVEGGRERGLMLCMVQGSMRMKCRTATDPDLCRQVQHACKASLHTAPWTHGGGHAIDCVRKQQRQASGRASPSPTRP